jgi:nucleoid-associated protein YgaU
MIALGVVLIGFCAALPFRQTPVVRQERAAIAKPVSLPLRRADGPLAMVLPNETSPASGLAADSPPSATATLPMASGLPNAPTRSETMNVAPPPAMPIAFHPISDELKPTSWKPTPPGADLPVVKPRKYVLRDGDSLERLAERFLGNRARAEEIFAMNRHVLSREDLLPVGKEIVLPARKSEGSE